MENYTTQKPDTIIVKGRLVTYKTMPGRLISSIKNLDKHQLSVLPFSDSFSLNEIVFYLADSELNDSVSFREILTGKECMIKHREHDLWGKILGYQEKNIYDLQSSLTLFEILRNMNAKLLESAGDLCYCNINHSIAGSVSICQLIDMIIKRDEKCINQVLDRKKLFDKLVDLPIDNPVTVF